MDLLIVKDRLGDNYYYLDYGSRKVCLWNSWLPTPYGHLRVASQKRYPVLDTKRYRSRNRCLIVHFTSIGIIVDRGFYDLRDKSELYYLERDIGETIASKIRSHWQKFVRRRDNA